MLSLFVVLALLASCEAHSEDWRTFLHWAQKTKQENNQNRIVEDKFVGDETKFFKNVKAITNSGTNAEAYWSFDGRYLSFQAIRGAELYWLLQTEDSLGETHPCDQIYIMNADGSNITLVSTKAGRDTCSYFYPDGDHVIFSMTTGQKYCPPAPDMSFGYDMTIFVRNLKDHSLTRLSHASGYNAESTISPDGKKIIFTSTRDGDLELYTMNLDGSDVRRMTYTPGYDGGAYFSNNNKMMVWRANRPQGAQLADYFLLLEHGLVRPSLMQILVQNVTLAEPPIQVTNNSGTNFAPFFLPDDSGVIFSSNLHNPMSGDFHLYTCNLDGATQLLPALTPAGSNLQRITTEGSFNSFPMFSPDGKKIAWCSDRGTTRYGDINVIVADWIGPGRKLQNIRRM